MTLVVQIIRHAAIDDAHRIATFHVRTDRVKARLLDILMHGQPIYLSRAPLEERDRSGEWNESTLRPHAMYLTSLRAETSVGAPTSDGIGRHLRSVIRAVLVEYLVDDELSADAIGALAEVYEAATGERISSEDHHGSGA